MDLSIQKAFEKAIYALQAVPADQAASLVASWLSNLVEIAEQSIIDFVEQKLDAIFDKFDADKVSEELAILIHGKIQELFSEQNLYDLFLPLLESLQSADMEKVADTIAQWLIDLGIVADNISEEELMNKLTDILTQLIGNIDADNAVDKLVELMQNSEITEGLDATLLTKVIEMKIYDLMYVIARDINAIENIEVTLQRK